MSFDELVDRVVDRQAGRHFFVPELRPDVLPGLFGGGTGGKALIDGVLMDPPPRLWDPERFSEFVAGLAEVLTRAFVLCQVDPARTLFVTEVFARRGWRRCDQISMRQMTLFYGKGGSEQTRTRQAVLFATADIGMQDVYHQRSADWAVGWTMPGGKAGGRLAIEQVFHEVMERLVVPKRGRGGEARVLVELWPALLDSRQDWYFVDEGVVVSGMRGVA